MKQHQLGFSLIEAMVALSLFTIFFVGATTLLADYETSQRHTEKIRVVQDLGNAFVTDWANYSRQHDRMKTDGSRPSVSVLDVFTAYDFKDPDLPAAKNQLTLSKVIYWRTKLTESYGINIVSWELSVTSPSGHYRQIQLTVNGEYQILWYVCC